LAGGGEPRPVFQGASADGDVVFFTDSERLTEDASPGGTDLYRCKLDSGNSGAGCIDLDDVSAPIEGSGESAEVMGVVPGYSSDGSRIYFVAHGVLDQQPNGLAESAVAGEPNLYLWERGAGTRFVARLSLNDGPDWGSDVTVPGARVSKLSASSSPSGRYFTFMSERSLTGYDNLSASDEKVEEAFIFDAVTDQLSCVSCSPSNAGIEHAGLFSPAPNTLASAVDPEGVWEDHWVASTLPEAAERVQNGASLYQPRFVFDSGRMFFHAIEALVPADTNGDWDVYQYEPLATGDCVSAPSGAAVARSGPGCVSLISSGVANGASAFLDSSATGDDVFFMTRGMLSVLDDDEAVDVYDARVNGVEARRQVVPECNDESCRPVVAAPLAPSPGSASPAFSRAENIGKGRRCPKGKHKIHRRGRTKCVPRKKHKEQHGSSQKKGGRR
jgi:hypothetical protein